ncbi:uncharacterized protein LOC132448321 [Gadus macrocephalus]|uniref:uncharacterized protein LOC132448321 n=1 Tax=Gadus macrocephalus TaxID=80720 RepID=UPI0028CB9FCC|nr:uncharacterized protein LOC132448321 [Gadus macrocephalus]
MATAAQEPVTFYTVTAYFTDIPKPYCLCAIGRAKCHHVAALLIWAENNLTRTDVECVWKRAPAPKTDEVTAKRVSVIAPSTSQAGIKRPVTLEDREWTLNSLAQLGRFTGLGWILAPETPQTFDGVVTSSGYGNAEDKALMAYRHERITASNFGLVLAALKRNSYRPSLFKTLLGQYNLKQGSHVSDGTVADDFIIEVKCPYSARTKTNLQAAERKDYFLELDEVTGLLKLKPSMG